MTNFNPKKIKTHIESLNLSTKEFVHVLNKTCQAGAKNMDSFNGCHVNDQEKSIMISDNNILLKNRMLKVAYALGYSEMKNVQTPGTIYIGGGETGHFHNKIAEVSEIK